MNGRPEVSFEVSIDHTGAAADLAHAMTWWAEFLEEFPHEVEELGIVKIEISQDYGTEFAPGERHYAWGCPSWWHEYYGTREAFYHVPTITLKREYLRVQY